LKIIPENRIKTTGIILKTGGFLRFRVLNNSSGKVYQILSSGQRFTVNSPVKLYKNRYYEAQLENRNNNLFLDKIHLLKSEKQNSTFKELPESKESLLLTSMDVPQEPYESRLFYRYEHLEDAVIEESAAELFLLEPLIVLFKEKQYSGSLSLILKKKRGTKIFTLRLEKDDLKWKFNLSSLEGRLSIAAFCSKEKIKSAQQEQWDLLCQKWKTLGIEADNSIKILRSSTELAENKREDVSRIIDIEV